MSKHMLRFYFCFTNKLYSVYVEDQCEEVFVLPEGMMCFLPETSPEYNPADKYNPADIVRKKLKDTKSEDLVFQTEACFQTFFNNINRG